MREYLNEQPSGNSLLTEITRLNDTTVPDDLPIYVKKGGAWAIIDEPTQRLQKGFKFDTLYKLIAFLNEVLEYQKETDHHGKIIIDGMTVTIEVYTHDVNLVTEVDMEYAKAVDEILDDVDHFAERDSFE